MNNSLMNEIDEIDRNVEIDDFSNEPNINILDIEKNYNVQKEVQPNFEPNHELSKIEAAQQKLGEQLTLLRGENPTPYIVEKIKECESKIIILEEIIEIMLELGPTATINEAIAIRNKKENDKNEIENKKAEKPKVKTMTNPNVPSEFLATPPEQKPENYFYKSFIYMALTCGALMGAYISILF